MNHESPGQDTSNKIIELRVWLFTHSEYLSDLSDLVGRILKRPLPPANETHPIQKQVRLSAAERQELIKLYKAGLPAVAIAKQFGIHRNTLYSILKQEGASVHRPTSLNNENPTEQPRRPSE